MVSLIVNRKQKRVYRLCFIDESLRRFCLVARTSLDEIIEHLVDLYKIAGNYIIGALQKKKPQKKRRGRRRKSEIEEENTPLMLEDDSMEQDDSFENDDFNDDDFSDEDDNF